MKVKICKLDTIMLTCKHCRENVMSRLWFLHCNVIVVITMKCTNLCFMVDYIGMISAISYCWKVWSSDNRCYMVPGV